MTNTPIKPVHSSNATGTPQSSSPSQAPKDSSSEAGAIASSEPDAVTISVPRTQASDGQATRDSDEAKAALESLLNSLQSKDAVAAHGGLDPSRVFKLLQDDE